MAGEAQTIVENCGNTLILRCASSEHGGTSQFASRLIGERELLRRHLVRGREAAGWRPGGRRSLQISEQPVTESAVLASELEQLPDLEGYLKTASSRAWLRVKLAHAKAG
jgi:Type IV secretion-system coupling protein DNA-binding domain